MGNATTAGGSVSVFGLMVTKNEAHRYLDAATLHAVSYLDGLLVFDDHSTDSTCEIAQNNGAIVQRRPDEAPSFLEHEGAFRQSSLECLAKTFELQRGDWVLGIDADEFMVSKDNIRDQLIDNINNAETYDCWSIIFGRFEVWNIVSSVELDFRWDGQWGNMRCTRLFRWDPGGSINQRAMGCGNEPTYTTQRPMYPGKEIAMLHFGYADRIDAQEKYERYTALLDHGHENTHIQSIVEEPTLLNWQGEYPEVWRGVRNNA